MYVVQDSSDIDGIEHKPLRIMGESDRVDVSRYLLKNMNSFLFNKFLACETICS